ncbi:MAG: dihydroorotate dehydrogenase-like protein [Mangrovibacterium sp.]
MGLRTKYMGLDLKNPIVVASSGLANTVAKVKRIEEAGAGAVIMKSLFEEQILGEAKHLLGDGEAYPEAADYIDTYVRENTVASYVDFIREAKSAVSIPVIASIGCVSSKEWLDFTKKLEIAGADAIELNMFYVPTLRNQTSEEIELRYISLIREIKQVISIPVAVKVGPYFTNLISFVEKLLANGADSVTMFNRFYEPDININTLKMIGAEVFSTPQDIRHSLRWIGLTSSALPQLEIAASTGIHDGEAAIKMILAGSQVVQVCSTVYINGSQVIAGMLKDMEGFMKKWNFKRIDDFRGRLSYHGVDAHMYERSQFMRYFSNHPMNK